MMSETQRCVTFHSSLISLIFANHHQAPAHFPDFKMSLKTPSAALVWLLLPMNNWPLDERLLVSISRSKTVCVELLATPNALPAEPTFTVAPARPAVLTLKPAAADAAPPPSVLEVAYKSIAS